MNAAPPSAHSVNGLAAEFQPAVTLLVNAIIGAHGSPAPLHEAEATIAAMRAAVLAIWPRAADTGAYEAIAGEAIAQVAVDIAPPVILAPDYEHWFDEAVISGTVNLERWYSYKQFLLHKKGYAPQVLDALDKASNDVVDLLGDPSQSGSWKRRGLVIGDVQSGKTATYIGIVNKAADAGYKLVVLLTGGTESLRKQTQYRIDEGLLGKDSSVTVRDKVLGVGHFPTTTTFLRGQGMTTRAKDFVGSSLAGQAVHIDPNADHPYVFVIKKNKTPLTNLISWLSTQFKGEQFNIPMLVVDDESDYASVNTNYRTDGDSNPTIINKKIRELLALTTRSSYMAFTATPFANVFIDHNSFDEALKDDLFPHHYIFALASPSNYSGAGEYFGTSTAKVAESIVDITDAHDIFPAKHKSHLTVTALPESLEEAIRAFIVASAIRLARGDRSNRAMLVNVSRFKNVQAQVFDLVSHQFGTIKAAVEIHAQPGAVAEDRHEELLRLRETYNTHFAKCGTAWAHVRGHLFAAVFDTTVQLVNSSRDKNSDDEVRNMIAVGGDVLSRGLTLEGLTVSYFYRLVGAADTLLQMARWFGYRPGYKDLVRVWISPDIADQFRFVHEVTEELRGQIADMKEMGRTPEDFGLMVRKHPETLAITAKRGVSEAHTMVISLSGRRIETTKIPAEINILIRNETAVREFLAGIESDQPETGWAQAGLLYQGKHGVSKDRVADLLESFRYDRGNLILANALHKIIREQRAPAFQDWTVGLVGGTGSPLRLTESLVLSNRPTRAVRYSPEAGRGTFRVSGSSARLAGSTDLAKTYRHEGPDLQEPAVYEHLPHPTLLIYALEPKLDVIPSGESEHAKDVALQETEAARAVWETARAKGLKCLMALKLAIPGAPGSRGGDVVYLLNGPAIEEFSRDFALDSHDLEELDD